MSVSPLDESINQPEKTFLPTICGGVGSPNSARIDGAMSTSDGEPAADRAVAEQHAGHFERIGAVVGAPGRVVVEQDLLGQIAQAGGPRRAVAAGVADDQVGRQGRRVARVDLVGAVDAPDDRLAVEVGDGLEAFLQLRQQRFPLFAGLDDAVALAAFQIQIKSVDSQSVRRGARPVDVVHDRRALARAEVAAGRAARN